MKLNAHYNPSTGEVLQFDNCPVPPERGDGSVVLTLDIEEAFPGRYACANHFKVVDDKLVEVGPPPVSEIEVACAIYAELCATDQYMVPDRPMSDDKRQAWRNYRQTLRDLSKLPVDQRIIAWPQRPDGQGRACDHLRR